MRYCVAVDCRITSKNGSKMTHFPTCPIRKAQWIAKVDRPGWTPHKYSTLCDKHFADDAWENPKVYGRTKLKRNAVPTLLLKPALDISSTVDSPNEANGGSSKANCTCAANITSETSQISPRDITTRDQAVNTVEILDFPAIIGIQTDTQTDKLSEVEQKRKLEIAHANIQRMQSLLKRKDRVVKVMKTQLAKQREAFAKKIKYLQNERHHNLKPLLRLSRSRSLKKTWNTAARNKNPLKL